MTDIDQFVKSSNIDQLIESVTATQIGEYALTLSSKEVLSLIIDAKGETVQKIFESIKTVQKTRVKESPSEDFKFVKQLSTSGSINIEEQKRLLDVVDKQIALLQETINSLEPALSGYKLDNCSESNNAIYNFGYQQYESTKRDLINLRAARPRLLRSIIEKGSVTVE